MYRTDKLPKQAGQDRSYDQSWMYSLQKWKPLTMTHKMAEHCEIAQPKLISAAVSRAIVVITVEWWVAIY